MIYCACEFENVFGDNTADVYLFVQIMPFVENMPTMICVCVLKISADFFEMPNCLTNVDIFYCAAKSVIIY